MISSYFQRFSCIAIHDYFNKFRTKYVILRITVYIYTRLWTTLEFPWDLLRKNKKKQTRKTRKVWNFRVFRVFFFVFFPRSKTHGSALCNYVYNYTRLWTNLEFSCDLFRGKTRKKKREKHEKIELKIFSCFSFFFSCFFLNCFPGGGSPRVCRLSTPSVRQF